MAIRNALPKVTALKALADRVAGQIKTDAPAQWRAMQLSVSHLSDGAQALHNLALARNPTITDGEHVKRIAQAADKYSRETTAAINAAMKHLDSGLSESDARIRAKTKLTPDAYAAETRTAFRELNPTQKAALLTELIDQNRGPELAALVRVPGMLTGLNDRQRTDYEAAFISRHAPEEVDLQQALKAAHEHVMVATKTGYELAKEYADPVTLNEISKAETAATAAAKAFADATQASGTS